MSTRGFALLTLLGLLVATTSAHADDGSGQHGIVGGELALEGQWPAVAAVLDGNLAICTGTLVAPRLVVTAAHCLGYPGDFHVRLGSINAESGGEVIKVVRTVEHPNWDTTYDAALLLLESDASVPPMPTAVGCGAEKLRENAEIVLVGFGAFDGQGSQWDGRLRVARTGVLDPDCTKGDGCMEAVSPGGELVAGSPTVDSCFGDSGGPLLIPTDGGHMLAGIVSRGIDSAPAPCLGGGIYPRVDAIEEWIEVEAGVDLEEDASCAVDDGSDTDGDADPDGDTTTDDDSGGCSAVGSSDGPLGLTLLLVGLAMSRRRRRASGCHNQV